ncbi:hypothetical protein HPP92_028608, partial [Vanilla planifolia]
FGQSSASPFGSPSVFGQTNSATSNPFSPKPFGSPILLAHRPGVHCLALQLVFSGSLPRQHLVHHHHRRWDSMPSFGASSSRHLEVLHLPLVLLEVSDQLPVSLVHLVARFNRPSQHLEAIFWFFITFFGASSQPAFGATSASAFGSASSPAFGMAFGASSTPAFGSQSTPAFGAPSTSLFGSSSTPAFGGSSTPSFGSSTPAFGGSSTSFSFGSAPFFGQSAPTFGSGPSPFGTQPSPFGAQTSTPASKSRFWAICFGSQGGGSRVSPYTATSEPDASGTQPAGKLNQFLPCLLTRIKSHEELRWEDYQRGDKGGPNPAGQQGGITFPTLTPVNPLGQTSAFGQTSTFGQTSAFGQPAANPFSSTTSSNPFAPKPAFWSYWLYIVIEFNFQLAILFILIKPFWVNFFHHTTIWGSKFIRICF